MTTTDTALELRQELVGAHLRLLATAERYRNLALPGTGSRAGDVVAQRNSILAANYAYTLAAILGEITRAFGDVVGDDFAQRAQTILTDGDHDDLNADVMDKAART